MGSRERKKAALNLKSTDFFASTSSTPEVSVETLEKGLMIKVKMEKKCEGLLVRILEAFEQLGLELLDANVSCSDSFQLQALGEQNEGSRSIKPQVVKKAVKQAIKEWSESNEQE